MAISALRYIYESKHDAELKFVKKCGRGFDTQPGVITER